MAMRNKVGSFCILVGMIFMGAAALLFVRNQQEAKQAEIKSEAAFEQMNRVISEKEKKESVENLIPKEIETEDQLLMKEIMIEGQAYIGYISIPTLNLELPVLSEWDYDLLKIAPCRYQGSVLDEKMILMAHNYEIHFGRIDELGIGDSIYFTDVDGKIYDYEVVDRDLLAASAVEEMTSGEFDLALFTCTYGGRERVTIYCEKR